MLTQEKKVFYYFIKYFSKSIRQMKGNFVYKFLIQKHFLNTRSRQSTFLLTNQNVLLVRHEPINFELQKFKIWASKQASCKWKRYQLWILLNLWEKCLKFGENRRNIENIYDSVRKELQDEITVLDRSWKQLELTRFGSPRRSLRSWIAHRALWSFAGLES